MRTKPIEAVKGKPGMHEHSKSPQLDTQKLKVLSLSVQVLSRVLLHLAARDALPFAAASRAMRVAADATARRVYAQDGLVSGCAELAMGQSSAQRVSGRWDRRVGLVCLQVFGISLNAKTWQRDGLFLFLFCL